MLNELVSLDYLWDSFVPRMARYGFDAAAALTTVLVDNPARLLRVLSPPF